VTLYVYAQQRRTKYAVRFTNLALLANVVSESPRWKRHVPPALLLAAMSLLLMGVARPERNVEVPREQATVILVMDVSGSMNAQDVEPTRLLAAKEAATAFLEDIPATFRVGMVSFAQFASVVLPPTHDRELALDALSRLEAVGGTAMGDAIVLALQAAQEPQEFGGEPAPTPEPGASAELEIPPTVLLLLSDGYNTAGFADPVAAAEQAGEMGVRIFTVALGTASGYVDVIDRAGRIQRVNVPPDEETLEDIAAVTDAEFFSVLSGDELTRVYESLSSKLDHETEKREITWWFAGLAAMFLAASAGLSLAWFNRFP
jgi:Ca-activated chloride channel family protein